MRRCDSAQSAVLVLDAGTGIRRMAATIQGLGFFSPLYRPDVEVHLWGPGSTTLYVP